MPEKKLIIFSNEKPETSVEVELRGTDYFNQTVKDMGYAASSIIVNDVLHGGTKTTVQDSQPSLKDHYCKIITKFDGQDGIGRAVTVSCRTYGQAESRAEAFSTLSRRLNSQSFTSDTFTDIQFKVLSPSGGASNETVFWTNPHKVGEPREIVFLEIKDPSQPPKPILESAYTHQMTINESKPLFEKFREYASQVLCLSE